MTTGWMALRKDPVARRGEKVLAIFKADTIDRAAPWKRSGRSNLVEAEAASKRIVQANADAAEVLKPEQQCQLIRAASVAHAAVTAAG